MSLDEFREAGSLFDDGEDVNDSPFDDDAKSGKPARARTASRAGGNFLGISPAQRFILSLMFLFVVLLLGTFFLIATGKVVPPGLF